MKQALFGQHLMSMLQCWHMIAQKEALLLSQGMETLVDIGTGSQWWCGEGCRTWVYSIVYYSIFTYVYMYVCPCRCVHVSAGASGGQRFFPSPWVPGIKLLLALQQAPHLLSCVTGPHPRLIEGWIHLKGKSLKISRAP